MARWKKWLFGIAGLVLALYLALNFACITGKTPGFYPLLLHVTVLDEESQKPLTGANVTLWKPYKGEPLETAWQITDSDGQATVLLVTNERPDWCLPSVGYFKFPGVTLRLRADGYEPRDVDLVDALPEVPFRRSGYQDRREYEVSVRMKKQK